MSTTNQYEVALEPIIEDEDPNMLVIRDMKKIDRIKKKCYDWIFGPESRVLGYGIGIVLIFLLGGIGMIVMSFYIPPSVTKLTCSQWKTPTGFKKRGEGGHPNYFSCTNTNLQPNTICNTTTPCVCDSIYCLQYPPDQIDNHWLALGCVATTFGLLALGLIIVIFTLCNRGGPKVV